MLDCQALGSERHSLRYGNPAGSGARQVRASASLADEIFTKNADNPVMVYSKTYCPYCSQVKQLFGQYKVDVKVAELDQIGGVPPAVCLLWCVFRVPNTNTQRPLLLSGGPFRLRWSRNGRPNAHNRNGSQARLVFLIFAASVPYRARANSDTPLWNLRNMTSQKVCRGRR